MSTTSYNDAGNGNNDSYVNDSNDRDDLDDTCNRSSNNNDDDDHDDRDDIMVIMHDKEVDYNHNSDSTKTIDDADED